MRILGTCDRQIITEDLSDVKRVLASENHDRLSCLFLGSSYTYSSLNPLQFDTLGWQSYNLSIGGTGVYFTELILEDYLKSHKHRPARIIIDISPQTFSDQTDDWTAYPIHRHLLRPMSHEALLFRYVAINDYFKLLRKSAYKGFNNIGKSPVAPDLTQDSFFYYRGFYANYTHRSEMTLKKDAVLLKGLYHARFDQAKWTHLRRLIYKCKTQNIHVYWFVAPVPDLYTYYASPYLAQYEAVLQELREIKEAIEIPIDTTIFTTLDYRNTDHLNIWGAEKLGGQMLAFFVSQ